MKTNQTAAENRRLVVPIALVLFAGLAVGLFLRGLRRDDGADRGDMNRTAHDHAKMVMNEEAKGPEATPPAEVGGRLAAMKKAGWIDLENEDCPIMGNHVDEDDPTVVAYNGLIVRFCCPGCDTRFLDDPLARLRSLEGDGVTIPPMQLEPSAHPPVVDAGNTLCPIMGNEIEDDATTIVIRGVKIRLCCDSCITKALKNPAATLSAAAKSGRVPADRLQEEVPHDDH